jgi:hypothetical protein
VEVLIFTPTSAAILEAEPLLSKTVVPETVVYRPCGMLYPNIPLGRTPPKVQLEPSGVFDGEQSKFAGGCQSCRLLRGPAASATVVVNVPRFSVLLPEPVRTGVAHVQNAGGG